MKKRAKYLMRLLCVLLICGALAFVPGWLRSREVYSITGIIKGVQAGTVLQGLEKKELTNAAAALVQKVNGLGYNTVLLQSQSLNNQVKALCKAAAGSGVQVFVLVPANAGTEEVKTLEKTNAAGLIFTFPEGAGEEGLAEIAALKTRSKKYIYVEDIANLPPTIPLYAEHFEGIFVPAGEAPAEAAGLPVYYMQGSEDDFEFCTALFVGVQTGKAAGFIANTAALAGGTGSALSVYSTAAHVYSLPAFVMPAELAVSYPANGFRTYDNSVALTGTAAPEETVFINGHPVEDRGEDGSFVAPVSLAMGQNVFTLTQGSASKTLVVTRLEASTDTEILPADTTPLNAGTAVVVDVPMASLLIKPGSDEEFTFAATAGTTFTIQEVVETQRSGRYTYAYKTPGGYYVLAQQVKAVANPPKVFTGCSYTVGPKGEEMIVLQGSATLATAEKVGNTLRVILYEAGFGQGVTAPSIPQGGLIKSIAASTGPAGETVLELSFENDASLWGWQITNKEENGETYTVITCRGGPILSASAAQPLLGVTVLLDPGHGGEDYGAMGLGGGIGGPAEKDLNLALAGAVRLRLEQLGATVYMTREGDEFPSLVERLDMVNSIQPHFFIAVHHNSTALRGATTANNTVEAYNWEPTGAALATNLAAQVSLATGHPTIAPKNYRFYVTRTTICPAVLFEYGYIVNTVQYKACYSTGGILQAAAGTANAVLQCVQQQTLAMGQSVE